MDDFSDFERTVYKLSYIEERAANILASRSFGDVMGGLIGGSIIGLMAAADAKAVTLAYPPAVIVGPYAIRGIGYLYHKYRQHEEKAASALTHLKDKSPLLWGAGLCAGAAAAYFLLKVP